jgi:hypothetical protein
MDVVNPDGAFVYSRIGPVVHLLNAFGLILAHNMPQGLGYAQGMAGFVVGVWAFAVSRPRLSPRGSFLVTLLLVFQAIAPFDTGNSRDMTSADMSFPLQH